MRFILIIFLFSFSTAFTQEIKFLPLQRFQFPQNFAFINPASNTSEFKYEVNFGHRGNAGEFNNTYVSYFNGQVKFYRSQKRYHSLGVNLISYHDGQFLRKNQLQLNYAWHMALSEKISLAAGATMAMLNYAVLSTPLTNGASSMAPDGTIGMWMYDKEFYLGASINQIYNGKLRPFNEVTRMVRHYTMVAGREFKINADAKIRSAILWRAVPELSDNFNLMISSLLKEVLLVGFNYQYHNGISLTAGVENVRIDDGCLRVLFSYQIYTPSNKLNLQSYEIGLAYFLKNRSNVKKVVDSEMMLEEGN